MCFDILHLKIETERKKSATTLGKCKYSWRLVWCKYD